MISDELDVYLSAHCSDLSSINTSPAPLPTSRPSMDQFDSAAPKRKMEGDSSGDLGYLGNPSKVPKIESKTPGSPQLLTSSLSQMSGGIKTEIKSELDSVDNVCGGRAGVHVSGGNTGAPSFSCSDETFLLDKSGATAETPVDKERLNKPSPNNSAAAKIRLALEKSGLSGNLTSEDLQTLKKLNEIAKSTELSQEAKSSEASQLLKNNPNVSRLLLKLRAEKKPGDGVNTGQYPSSGQFSGQQSAPSYNANYAGGHQPQPNNNNNNYYQQQQQQQQPGPGGQWQHPQQQQQPGSPYYGQAPGHMGRMGHDGGMGPGYSGNYMSPVRGGNMYPGQESGMMMHPGIGGMSSPRTYMIRDRQTGMLMPGFPGGPGPVMGARAGGYHAGVPPPYMSPNSGYHHPGMMARGRMMTPMVTPGPGSPYDQRHAGPVYSGHEYDNSFPAPAAAPPPFSRDNFRDQSMMRSSEFRAGGQQSLPPHTGVSQLRERLSRPGPSINNSLSGGSELAHRLMHGKPGDPPPGYLPPADNTHNNAFTNGNNLKAGSEALFDEINNTPFEYFNSFENTNDNQSSQTNYNIENNEAASGQMGVQWKNSPATQDVRNTMLRKLSTAIESNNIPAQAATKLAHDIELKAFGVANSENEYKSEIAHHLAKIFSSQSKTTDQSDTCPDSTTWQEPASGQPPNSSPDSSFNNDNAAGSHFQSDATLNCFQVCTAFLLNNILQFPCHSRS